MKLLMKFNLILAGLFGVGCVLVGFASYQFLMQNARDQVVQQAELMIESARSTRQYTADELAPLLNKVPDHDTQFLPETIPFYAATTTFNYLRQNHPDYAYKEAALNPSNLRDRAVDWESDLINYFRNNAGTKKLIGERDTPTGRMLYIAYPIAADASCLGCHGEASDAPPSILHKYGNVNGFGWKADEVVAAQIVSVPMAVPIQIARHAFRTLVAYLVVIFVVAIVIIDAALVFLVIRPVRKLSTVADRISSGETGLPELPVEGTDEISAVTASFNRMYVSLQKAFQMLNG
jgi:protein-histidine pros-kinase